MTTAVLATPPYLAFYDLNGAPLSGGLVYTYAAGTTTPKATYTDQSGVTPMSNPIVLDSAGRNTWWLIGSYKYIVKDSLGNTIATTDNVTGFSTGTTIAAASITYDMLSGTIPIGSVNKFRNPGVNIWQRGTSVSVLAGTTAYTADGWMVGTVGAAATVVQGGQIGYSLNTLQITGNASMTDTFIKQRIESSTAAPFYGQQVTVTLRCWNAGTGVSLTPTLTVNTPTATDNYTSTNSVVSAVSFQTIPYLTSQVISYTFACPTSVSNGLEVIIDFGSVLNSGAKYLLVTDFDIRITPNFATGQCSNPPTPELPNAQANFEHNMRYYRKSFPYATAPAQNAGRTGALATVASGTVSGTAVLTNVQFGLPMRIAPTVTLYSPSSASAGWRNQTASSDLAATAAQISEFGFVISNNAVATDINYYDIHYSATAEL